MSPVQTVQQKIEIITTNALTKNGENSQENLLKPICIDSPKETTKDGNVYNSIIDFLLDESLSTIPIFMKYFALHESIVLICGGLYYLTSDYGVLCLSIIPGISLISIFTHFLLTQFKNKPEVNHIFYSIKHYMVALSIFTIGLLSIYFIYQTNTYLSTLVPTKVNSNRSSSTQLWIREILQFPYTHSMKKQDDDFDEKPFNFRISFVGSIIAPIIEESFKYILVAFTFPITFIWSFANKLGRNAKPSYSEYCIQSLFIMFIALCGGCGIAIMENIGYLAACEWEKTKMYCLPNKNFDILGAGLARGIFSVPFHCVTACIMADILCMWMNTNIGIFRRNKCMLAIKFILSYPICIMLPILLHSSFNYWMKGIPFMTGLVTIVGFSFLASRIAKKHAFINDEEDMKKKEDEEQEMEGMEMMVIDQDEINLTICDPLEEEICAPLVLL